MQVKVEYRKKASQNRTINVNIRKPYKLEKMRALKKANNLFNGS